MKLSPTLTLFLFALVSLVICVNSSFIKADMGLMSGPFDSSVSSDNNWYSDCKYGAEDRYASFIKGPQNLESKRYYINLVSGEPTGFWSLGGNDTRSHCSIVFVTSEPKFKITTFLSSGSTILVTLLKASPLLINATANSTWIKESGWTNNTIERKLVEGELPLLGFIITLFNPTPHGLVLVKDLQPSNETNAPGADQDDDDSRDSSKSLQEEMKEFNIFILTIVAFLILALMVMVIFVTCIQRCCPPCSKGKSFHDYNDESTDAYDEDDLMDAILDTNLRMGLKFDQPQPEQTSSAPIFFSSNWASAFNLGEKQASTVQPSASNVSLTINPTDLHKAGFVLERSDKNVAAGYRDIESEIEIVSVSTQTLVDST